MTNKAALDLLMGQPLKAEDALQIMEQILEEYQVDAVLKEQGYKAMHFIRKHLTDAPSSEGVREAVDTVKEAKYILDQILKGKPAHIVDEVRKNGVGKFVVYELIDHGFIRSAQSSMEKKL